MQALTAKVEAAIPGVEEQKKIGIQDEEATSLQAAAVQAAAPKNKDSSNVISETPGPLRLRRHAAALPPTLWPSWPLLPLWTPWLR